MKKCYRNIKLSHIVTDDGRPINASEAWTKSALLLLRILVDVRDDNQHKTPTDSVARDDKP